MIHAINEFLVTMRQNIKNIEDEEFEIQKKSVYTQYAEKDKNLTAENSRFWGEIATHKYKFHRQKQSLKVLTQITKKEFQDHFEKYFFSDETRRLDFEYMGKNHHEEQKDYREKNKDHQIFKLLNRVPIE